MITTERRYEELFDSGSNKYQYISSNLTELLRYAPRKGADNKPKGNIKLMCEQLDVVEMK